MTQSTLDATTGDERGKKRKKSDVVFKKTKRKWEEEEGEMSALAAKYPDIDPGAVETFADLPLSKATLEGLKEAGFKTPTDIQRQSIGLALQGNDVLGAAKTGSGKTLAFLVPLLELLRRNKWSSWFGLGALVVSPTRELAYQTFEVLRKIGRHHDFSAGLVIGGKDVAAEAKLIARTNIVVCTPGRLLQHMDETPDFQCNDLEILVLDEADRILDMGFAATINAIVENLPPTRQTLLFSATQTKSLKDLARLSLKSPMFVSVHENDKHSTPDKLTQSYMVVQAHEKINLIWSFIKSHLRSKILIFVQSCKEVRFLYHLFCRLRPGLSVLGLHGHMKQSKRMEMYETFCSRKRAALFATDVASRGLDFPSVNWVVQMDCPEDVDAYIHRAGRTARFEEGGEALLLLTPREEKGMIGPLRQRKIPVSKIAANPSMMKSVEAKAAALLAADPDLKMSAQRAFVSYIRSCHVMSDKAVFDVKSLDFPLLAKSLGLAVTPRVRFLERAGKLSGKTKAAALKEEEEAGERVEEEEEKMDEEEVERTHATRSGFGEEEEEDNDDMLVLKKQHVEHLVDAAADAADAEAESPEAERRRRKRPVTKEDVARKLKNKGIVANVKTVFDAEGAAVDAAGDAGDEDEEGGLDLEEARRRLKIRDEDDKKRESERVKRMHREQKVKEKERERREAERKEKRKRRGEEEEEEMEVVLGRGDEEEEEEDYSEVEEDEGDSREDDGESSEEDEEDENDDDDSDEEDDSKSRLSLDPSTRSTTRIAEEDGDDDEDDDDDDDEEDSKDFHSKNSETTTTTTKRKWKAPKKPKIPRAKRRRRHDDDDDEPFDTGLSLGNDEELALQLLRA